MTKPLFRRAAIVGIGLIGSSLARAWRESRAVERIVVCDSDAAALAKARDLALGDAYHAAPGPYLAECDLILVAAPLGAYAGLGQAIGPYLAPGTILTDVGSVKQAAIRDLAPHVPEGAHFIPGHPIAGTEHSGPEAGFAELFRGRWCILTPLPGGDAAAVDRLSALWQAIGSEVEIMEAGQHDQILAITSHLPHLIAYSIVDTAALLEESTKSAVIKFSASGFRDFTRIAASNPIMWRDVFLNNRDAVLEMLARFSEDLTALQRAIRWGEGDKLEEVFTRTRAIRRGIIDAKQA